MSQSRTSFPTDRPAVVTCGLPYANGDLHIGHLRGNLSADVFARSLETLGQQTAYVCGSDMHGTPIAVEAEQEGVPPEEFALRYHEQYEETFERFNIEFDNYGHTHQPTNIELTKEIVHTLDERGYVTERAIEVAWDPIEEQPLPDRYVEGTCPYCGATARGDECDEGCGRHLEPGEIEEPTSVITGNPAEYRTREHKFFRLSELQEYLQAFIDRLEGTDNARNQPREWIEGELEDWCITRDLDWGIDYPDEETDLVLYVWVDAPIEYIASTKQYTDRVGADVYDWESAWKEDGEIVHVIGPDIIQHHTVFWPAMLHAVDYTEPRAVMASGFVTLNGEGFSTSRNRAVWAREYLDEGFDPDLLRYYITTHSGFQQDLDFSWDRFQERVNSELLGTLGNFIYRSLLFAHRNYDGTPDVPCPQPVADRIETALASFEEGVNDYSIREIGTVPIELARFGNEYIQRNEPWKLTDEDPEQAATVIRGCVQLAKAIAVLLEPTAPNAAARIWSQLEQSGSVHDATLDTALAAPPDQFDEPTELFESIEDEQVETLTQRLEDRQTQEADDATDGDDGSDADATALEPLADDRISFEEFQALDLRVGRITDAEPIEGADKLVKLAVDIGHETRQVVAGLRQLHDTESLPGTRVVLLANLEKAELFGVESNGMVLAAGEKADLLTTHGETPPGTSIK
ncbi:methionine--tRNA ligase [Halocatena pleomorpha]|uniref:Methionine--tRNA ligase n=1 Tax=Halocatena pleomorpha TaxID=1785090 RepID=A0A3P3R8M8_9EURY|nr:methionine--tRNA ligase [Halocatena pleomorpha]RRJ28893.1 methionine--tRNA ligase [Halocatena pleomorpha]